MRVNLIARTVVDHSALAAGGYRPHDYDSGGTSADELAEFAGRLCYQSWSRPNPDTATNRGYVGNILRQGHFSVLEHSSATFLLEDVSRSLTHELVRHRHLSVSQLSQRYVPAERMDFVVPPAFAEDEETAHELSDWFDDAREMYSDLVARLEDSGVSGKRAREAARCVLPNMTATDLVVSGNLRAWREVVLKRNSHAADAEIRQLAGLLLAELQTLAPNTFQDFTE